MSNETRISAHIENAAAHLTPYWPLQTFIAANPLQGLEHLSFEEAVELGADLFRGRGYPSVEMARAALADGRIDRAVLTEVAGRHGRPELVERLTQGQAEAAAVGEAGEASRVNPLTIKWLAAFLDEGQAAWPMPGREKGLWRAFKALALHDPTIPQRRRLASLPEQPLAALVELLCDVPEEERESRLTAHLVALPGWSSYVKWRAGQSAHPWQKAAPITLADYLAVRVALAWLLDEPAPSLTAEGTAAPDGAVWLEAWEESYRRRLLDELQRASDAGSASAAPPSAQLVFCIDVRSEVFRRHLERIGPYDTLGFAGFFGIPIAYRSFGEREAIASCPVLLSPAHTVREVPACDHEAAGQAHLHGRRHIEGAKTLVQQLKESVATPFAFVEAAGGLFGLAMAGRTLQPGRFGRLLARLREAVSPRARLAPQIELLAAEGDPEAATGFSAAERVFYAEAALSIMGLTRGIAPLVVLAGHGGATVNNPFASGLDCGACGGNRGGPNARTMATILNDPQVRAGLAERGIEIPEATLFLAAEHNTTTDAVEIFDADAGAARHPEAFARLVRDLEKARSAAAAERCRRLTGAEGDSVAAVAERAADWAQVRPEWALAKNAAFIVGHRDLTRSLDLQARGFLHSYDWRADAEGKALEVILTAPMVVAEWINTQYYFSTVDPVVYGAGSKITHNVVGTFGVMQGNASDLMTGLPLQSVMAADDVPYHEPLRLMTVVQAPVARVEEIVRRNTVLQTLFGNGWVALTVLDPETGEMLRRSRTGAWRPALGESAAPTSAGEPSGAGAQERLEAV
ncbi:hypothetical protein AY599_25230 [Leptolyngbya valderiana BDU 20041]|nr:hypothetical protein AY599_25230 [Leptolyngbya valderiana BDU 20041]